MTFTATESSSAPIVLSKRPVPRPPISYGYTRIPQAQFDPLPAHGDRVSFTTVHGPYVVTYHDVPVHGVDNGDVVIWVSVGHMVTWTVLDVSN